MRTSVRRDDLERRTVLIICCCLQSIADFEVSHPRVVDKLRELKDRSDRYRDASSFTDDDLPGRGGIFCETQTSVDEHGGSTASGREGPVDGGNSCTAWTQSDVVTSVDAATQQHQSMDCYTGDINDDDLTVGTMTEEELKEKHDKVCMIVGFCYSLLY